LNKLISILILFSVFIHKDLFSQFNDNQIEKIYSLNLIIENSDQDSSIAKAYYDLSEILYVNNLDTLLYLCQKANTIAEINLSRNINKQEKLTFLKIKAGCLNNIGYVYKNHGDITKALEYYNSSLIIHEEIGDKIGKADLTNNIGVIYETQDEINKALEYYKISLKLYREVNYNKGIATSLNNIGLIYRNEKNNIEKALLYYEESLKIREEIGDKRGVSNSLNNIGYVYEKLNTPKKSLEYNFRSLKIREVIGDKIGIARSLFNIGSLKFNTGNINEAKMYAYKSLKIAQDVGSPSEIRNTSLLLKKIYKTEKNYKKELEMFELYSLMKDSITNKKNKRAVYKQQLQYQYEKKKAVDKKDLEKKIAIQDEKKQTQKFITSVVIFGLIFFLIFSIIIYNRWSLSQKKKKIITIQRDELDKKNEEKKIMMKEIHHRVKNNLQVVISLLRLQSNHIDDQEILSMFQESQDRIYSMALLHETMYSSKKLINIDIEQHFTTLIEQLIKGYQLNTKIDLKVDIEKVNLGIKSLIPLGLIINEVISNSLKHGFRDRPSGTITVKLQQIDNKTHKLIIGDDGVGIDDSKDNTSLGLELINVFTDQLEGTIQQLETPGLMYQIVFERID
jgi:two-component sensor histidine kinase